ncbi:MAG: cytochrome b N-terminal domain-containing protein [Rhizobacter sp.]|nr:cytochrome b N-terminal domain-containing protein [Chlorobiales bacterium]
MADLIAKLRQGVQGIGGFSINNWLSERIDVLAPVMAYMGKKSVPQHRASIWYYFGGLTLFFFVIQILTGGLLLFYYKPTEQAAFESFVYIQKEVPFGWLMRQMHSWSANLMVLMMFIHMFSAYFMKAYRKPRELMWLTGFILCLLTIGMGFTGYLLPWNQLAYFATKIGMGVAGEAPGGQIIANILQGGPDVSGETLTRMFSLHVVLLPGIILLVLSAHLLLMQVLGTSTPIGYKEQGLVKGSEPFFPNFLMKDFIGWMIGFALLIFLAVMYPWEIGEKADALGVPAPDIKPEWYLWAQFQLLKDFAFIGDWHFLPEVLREKLPSLIPITFFGIMTVLWGIVPFIDRKASLEQKSPMYTIFGLLTLGFFLVQIARVFVWTQGFKH